MTFRHHLPGVVLLFCSIGLLDGGAILAAASMTGGSEAGNPLASFYEEHPQPFSLVRQPVESADAAPLSPLFADDSPVAGPVKPERKLIRPGKQALFASLGFLSFSTIRYWIQIQVNKPDWEYQLNFHDQWKRIFKLDGISFDDNAYELNWTHSLAGGMYYHIARSSRLNMAQSLLATLACSTFWETVTEFKEVISINDEFMTVGGGVSLGETTFQLGDFFLKGDRTPFNRTMGWLFGFITRINRWVFRTPSPARTATDSLGFSLDYGHRFRFTTGVKSTRMAEGHGSNPELQGSVDLDLLHLTLAERQGSLHKTVKGPIYTGFHFGTAATISGMNEYVLRTETHFAARVHQEMAAGVKGEAGEGYRWYLGAINSFELIWRRYAAFKDKLTLVRLLGPVFDYRWRRQSFSLHSQAAVSADVGLISSHAFDRWSDSHDPAGVKTTLRRWGYYYGVGYSLTGLVEWTSGALLGGGEARYHHYASVQGLDRRQEDVTDDFPLRDSYFSWQAYFGVRLPDAPFSFRILYEGLERRGMISPLKVKDTDRRLYGQLVLDI